MFRRVRGGGVAVRGGGRGRVEEGARGDRGREKLRSERVEGENKMESS